MFGHKNTKYLQDVVVIGARHEVINCHYWQNIFIEMYLQRYQASLTPLNEDT